uniref:Uncharacterized protein LOC111134302 isoform X1 n=1 Tax=Crassostrea virginica TaxID=6565 RepID=A0A8B8EFP1_CRAVI|nr:uncharacterized protein LOC111134302 isoform X1 [Crassostrea virginica]
MDYTFMLTSFVILMAYIAFDLSVKSRLKEEIENLHNNMDLLLQSQREQENNMKYLMRLGKDVEEEHENLRKMLDRLQLQQKNAKIKMDAFSDYSKTNDDTLKNMKEGFLFFKDELFGDILKEIQRLLNQVTKMDEEIGKLGNNYEAVSDQLERLQNEMGHRRHNDHQKDVKRYSGGQIILDGIKSALNFIVKKIGNFVFGGIFSVFSRISSEAYRALT